MVSQGLGPSESVSNCQIIENGEIFALPIFEDAEKISHIPTDELTEENSS